jgi:hypothetical protein
MPSLPGYTIPQRYKALAPYVVGDSVRDNGDIDAHCPLHDDAKRSAVINFEDGVWWCARCDGGSIEELLSRRGDWLPPPSGAPRTRTVRRQAETPDGLPSEDKILEWKQALMSDPVLLDDLKATRGIWTKTVDAFEIGWDAAESAYTLPVRDLDGKLVNVRRYQLRPPRGRRKIWGVSGHNQPLLYPVGAFKKARREDEGAILVCEGEFDAIISNQYNFRAVTKTNGVKAWRREWDKLFKDLVVYVCHDADRPGQDANRKIARAVARYAKEVRIVRLPYAVTDDHGKDLTDWWLEHDADRAAFQRLLDEAQPFDEEMGEDPEEIRSERCQRRGCLRRAARRATARADRHRQGPARARVLRPPQGRVPLYPRRREDSALSARCTTPSRSIDHVVAGADPSVLEFLDATRPQIAELLRRLKGSRSVRSSRST